MNGHTLGRRTATIGRGIALLAVVSVVVAGTAGAAGTTTVRLATDGSVTHSGTTTVDVVVDGVDGGVGAYNVTVALDDPIASISSVELNGDPSPRTRRVEFSSDRSAVTMTAALADTADTGSVTIATVTLRGEDVGSTNLDLTVTALGDERGQTYRVAGVGSTTIAVTDGGAPESTGGDASPDDEGDRGDRAAPTEANDDAPRGDRSTPTDANDAGDRRDRPATPTAADDRRDRSAPPDVNSLDARTERAVAVLRGIVAAVEGTVALPVVVVAGLVAAAGLGVFVGRRT